jgi:MFS family permease
MVLAAHWSDVVGRKRLMRWGLGALVLWSLVFFPLLDTKSPLLIAVAVIGMLFVQGSTWGHSRRSCRSSFQRPCVYSGSSLSVTLASVMRRCRRPDRGDVSVRSDRNVEPRDRVHGGHLGRVSWLCALGAAGDFRDSLSQRD